MDLKETTNRTKSPEACYKHSLHKFLSCLILTHTLPMSTSPHIRTKNFFTLHPPPSFLPTYTQYPLPWWASMTLLELISLVQWKLRNPFAPINGLFIFQGPMKIWECIAIQLKLGWESLSPMKHKRYFILQSKRMTILMTNGIGRSILPLILDILMRSLELNPYIFRPLTLTSYFFILITLSN